MSSSFHGFATQHSDRIVGASQGQLLPKALRTLVIRNIESDFTSDARKLFLSDVLIQSLLYFPANIGWASCEGDFQESTLLDS